MLILLSATPSPYARKNRIALIEKGIPFELQTEIPWHSAVCLLSRICYVPENYTKFPDYHMLPLWSFSSCHCLF